MCLRAVSILFGGEKIAKLKVNIVKHFHEIDYGDSEVIIFRYFRQNNSVLLCIDDLSEKISDWVNNTRKTEYFYRYKMIYFINIVQFHRLEVTDKKYTSMVNDFYSERDNYAIPVDAIVVKKFTNEFLANIYFDRGFGSAQIECKQINIDELTYYSGKTQDGKNYVYLDKNTREKIDSKNILDTLYSGTY